MSEQTRHNQFHPDTRRVLITFRGSVPEDQQLLADLDTIADRDGVKFAVMVREALQSYVDSRRKCPK